MPSIAIVRMRDKNIRAAAREAVSLAGGFADLPWSNSTVLMKPNTVSPSPSGSGKVTDARLLKAVTEMVLEQGPKRVVIGEGSSVGYDFPGRQDSMHCMEVAGHADVARKLGVEIMDLNRDKQVEIKLADAYVMPRFRVARTAYEADIIICLPVIKSHMRTGITCGLKNMKGALPGDEKKRTHQMGLDRGIVDLNRAVKPDFTVVDAIVGCQGTHTSEKDKVHLDLVLAGKDVVAVDAVCAELAGFNAKDILHVQLAAEAGLGEGDLSRIEIYGEALEAVRHPFVPYLEASKEIFGGAVFIEKNTCTGCMGELMSPFIYLSRAGLANRLSELVIVAGSPEAIPPVKSLPVIVGKCAQEFRGKGVFIPGCPPHGIKIAEGMCETLGIDKNIVLQAIETLHDF